MATTIRDQHFIYHLTSLENVPSILQQGLQPRSALKSGNFRDVADPQIIEGRSREALEDYVPFHWFAKNPFDGRVHFDRPSDHFVLIAIYRKLARERNWRVIPRHPLAGGAFELFDYQAGVEVIDWDKMEVRDYQDPACRHVCTAECLSPGPVFASDFAKIFTPTEEIELLVRQHADQAGLKGLWIGANSNMFSR